MRTPKGMREHVQIRDRFESDTKHVENISGQPKIQETLHFFFNISFENRKSTKEILF